MKQIGKELQKRLKIKGVSQKELAEQLFVTQQAVSKWINDECYPSSDNIHLRYPDNRDRLLPVLPS